MIWIHWHRVTSLTGLLNPQSRAVNRVVDGCSRGNHRQNDARRLGRQWLSDERHTIQVRSEGGTRPESRPKRFANLGMRTMTGSGCGTEHDRDLNAARNIVSTFACGHATPVESFPAFSGGEDVKGQ